MNSFSLNQDKPVSHKLNEMVYFGQSFNFSLKKKINAEFFCIYANVHSVSLSTTKFHEIEWFKKSCAEVQKGRNSQKTRYVCEAQISPIMANFKDGLGHNDKYLDTSRKTLSQEMLMCNMKALIFII